MRKHLPCCHGLLLAVIFGLAGAFAATEVAADDIDIKDARVDVFNGILVLDADVDFTFGADAIDALDSGIALYFDLEVRLLQPRGYWWDDELFTTRRRFVIERHALSNQFVLSELITGERRLHPSLRLAIEDLGHIHHLPLIEAADRDLPADTQVALRISLDINALPAPMIPLAYVSPGWHMSSGWFEWPADL